jgi:Holliday junction resolvase RusA-like endonuclease
MTFQVIYSVYGIPQGKGRPRFTRQGRAYTPKKTMDYEEEIRLMAQKAMGSTDLLETPVAVYIYANFPIPDSYSKKRKEQCLSGKEKPTKKPDGDNICKAFCDAMNGVVYKDDAQVVSLHFTKRYDAIASVHVCVREELEF